MTTHRSLPDHRTTLVRELRDCQDRYWQVWAHEAVSRPAHQIIEIRGIVHTYHQRKRHVLTEAQGDSDVR